LRSARAARDVPLVVVSLDMPPVVVLVVPVPALPRVADVVAD
jgi:hypothetical protein